MTPHPVQVAVLPHRARPVLPSGLRGLFDEEGWWPERDETVLAQVLTAGPAVGAWSGDSLVGFARAVTDGICRAYLEDVIVRGDMRGVGIGERLVRELQCDLPDGAIITAFFGSRLEPFYRRLRYQATHQTVAHRAARAPRTG